MLTSLNAQIRHCQQRANECARKAHDAGTDDARNWFLALERDWLALARRYTVDDRDATRRRLNRWRGSGTSSDNAAGRAETILPFLIGKYFSPETVAQLSNAFERACAALMVSTSDPKAELIARKIIELAQRGLRDDTQLFCTAVLELNLRN
jgi:hypothetical protein